MSEQHDVVADLGQAGVLDALRWAYDATIARTLYMYSDGDGHDAALLGNLRFTYLRDRLDRVFSCGRYELSSGGSPANHLDLVYAELTQAQISSLPQLAPGFVVRADLNGSPGWALGQRRFLLAASAYGQIDVLPWPRKSQTKQRVAQQRQVDPAQGSLFAEVANEELAALEALVAAAFKLDMETFVLAHSLDVVTQEAELMLGRARHNGGGGRAWHWLEDILRMPPSDEGSRPRTVPAPSNPDAEPDAPVRLRRPAARRIADAAGEV